MQKTRFRLAMGQMKVEGGRPELNLARADGLIRDAAARGCEMIVLPECLDLGWTDPSARDLSEPVPGRTSDVLCRAAHAAGIFVAAGVTERDEDRVYNTAVLISPEGRLLLKHRKINILTIAQDLYTIGDRLGVAHTNLGTIGLDICADNFPDSLALGHGLGRMGAQLLVSPSAWAVDANYDNAAEPYGGTWLKSYTRLARLFEMTVVGVSNVGSITGGPWQGRKCIGCSLAVGPNGQIVGRGPYGESAEALIPVEVALVEHRVRGTAISTMLKEKGYTEP